MSRAPRLIITLTILALILASCGQATSSTGPAKPLMAVSILPQAYFVEALAGSSVDVMVLVGEGQSPHSYEPSPSQMADLSRAALWITTGIEFEHGLEPKVSGLYPQLPIIDGTKGVVYRNLEAHSHEGEGEHEGEEAHEGEEEHEGEEALEGEEHHDEEEGGLDPHIWLGRQAVLAQAEVITATLIQLIPAEEAQFRTRNQEFTSKVNGIFDELKTSLAPLQGRTALVFHPGFGYFLDEFGIKQVAIETGGKEPTARTLNEIIAEAQEEKAAAIFVQTQFPTSAAKTVADAIGAEVIALDNLARNWDENIKVMGNALLKALK